MLTYFLRVFSDQLGVTYIEAVHFAHLAAVICLQSLAGEVVQFFCCADQAQLFLPVRRVYLHGIALSLVNWRGCRYWLEERGGRLLALLVLNGSCKRRLVLALSRELGWVRRVGSRLYVLDIRNVATKRTKVSALWPAAVIGAVVWYALLEGKRAKVAVFVIGWNGEALLATGAQVHILLNSGL